MLAIIATKREAALLRKAAKAAGQQRLQPVDLQSLVAIPSKDAPATTAKHPSRKRNASISCAATRQTGEEREKPPRPACGGAAS